MAWAQSLEVEIAEEFAELQVADRRDSPSNWSSLQAARCAASGARLRSTAAIRCKRRGCESARFVPLREGTKYCSDRCAKGLTPRVVRRCARQDCDSGPFCPIYGSTKYCSARCHDIVGWRACSAARSRARRRELACLVCKSPVRRKRSDVKYCSMVCCLKAAGARKRLAQRAA